VRNVRLGTVKKIERGDYLTVVVEEGPPALGFALLRMML
jgi:molybdopterin-binding protein